MNHIPPGTAAGLGIAQHGHLNFFLVSHQGIKGTSIPCHYHVLHCDRHLVNPATRLAPDAEDFENVTYQLCHLYGRADKVVSYATPAYLADHLAERGKLHLEAHFPDSLEDPESVYASSDNSNESKLKEQVDERVCWFNSNAWSKMADTSFQGRHYFL